MYMSRDYNEAYSNYARCYEIVRRVAGTGGPKAMHYAFLCAASKSCTSNYAQAIPLYENLIASYKQRQDMEQVVRMSMKVLHLHLKAGDSRNAFRVVDEIIAYRQKGLLETMQQLADTLISYNYIVKGVAILRKILYCSSIINRETVKSTYKGECKKRKEYYDAYYSMGIAYSKTDSEKAYRYMNAALELAGSVYGKCSAESAKVYLAIGRIYKVLKDVYNARNNFKVAHEIVKSKPSQRKLLDDIENELDSC